MTESSGPPVSIDDLLKRATTSHQAGNLPMAVSLYKKVLAQEPEQADALHLLGLAAHQQGRPQEAEDLIGRAIGRDAKRAYFHNNLGEVRRTGGNLGGAEACYREALRLEPRYAQAHNNLGMTLHALGRFEESEGAFREALKLEPKSAEIHNNLGIVLQAEGRLDDAVAEFRQSLELNPGHAEARNNLGAALKLLGNLEQAREALEEAVRMHPKLARAHYNLAGVQAELGELEAAEATCRRAIELSPEDADFHVNLGHILRRRGEPDGALNSLRRALEIAPDHAMGLNDLGVMLLVRGEFDEAASCFRRALEASPDLAIAYENLARTRKFSDADGDDVALLASGLESRDLDEAAQIHRHFALGKVKDDLGDYDQAFSHFAEANRLMRAGLNFNIDEQRRFVDESIDLFKPAFLERMAPMGDPSEVPVFILGMPRSGTTLVEQILASHPDVHGGGELDFFPDAAASMSDRLEDARRYPLCLEGLSAESAHDITDAYLATLQRNAWDALRVTDKMPLNFEHLGLIAALFPNARIIHCRRNPLDVCLSIYFQHFAREVPFAYGLEDIAGYYQQYQRLMDHWQQVLPGRIFEVEYEQLVQSTESVIRALVTHCGLSWNDQCLRFFETERSVGTASHWQVRQPVYEDSLARWKRYEEHLKPLLSAFGPGAAGSG